MLTREVLAANAALSNLTEEQISTIETLSRNDENTVIAKKTGEIYGALDNDILSVTGVEKTGTEKTYDYAKRVLGEFKTKAESATSLQTQVDTLTREKTRLEKAIAEGAGDAEAAKALKQARADLAAVTAQYAELNKKYEADKADHEKALFGVRVDNELQIAASGLKFKSGFPESVTRVILEQAKAKIKGMDPEYIDDGNGGKMLAFKDATGAIMRNAGNALSPYTAKDLLTKELDTMGVLDKGRQGGGAGSHPRTPGNGSSTTIDVSGCRTQSEAMDAIKKALLAQGITVASKEYSELLDKAWKDNNIKSLPIR